MTESERYTGVTAFSEIYKKFYSRVTDQMYLEWTEAQTQADLENMLLAGIPRFEFPTFKLYDYTETTYDGLGEVLAAGQYNMILTDEERDILSRTMLVEWITRQLLDVDVVKQGYSSKDFQFTSQANHLAKLVVLKQEFQNDLTKAMRMYGRRKTTDDGYIVPNFSGLAGRNG